MNNTNNSSSSNGGGRRFGNRPRRPGNNNNNRNRNQNSNQNGQRKRSPEELKKRMAKRQPSLRGTIRQIRMNKDAGKRKTKDLPIPPVGDNVRIIPLGGVEEIGKNMTAIEIGDDIIVIDAGFQFKDPNETPGIDYIIPNTEYLEKNKDKIRAMFITHGHLDHIGGVPFVLPKIGNPKVYAREFGALMVKKKMEDFPHVPKADITILDGDETVTAGKIKVETFPISHTIPDSMGLIVNTPYGDIVFIEDVRVDNIDGVPTEEEVQQYKRFKDRNVLILTLDSTSVEKTGYSISENVVVENIDKIIKETHGRLIIGTFASQVERILAIIKSADSYGKKVVIEGRSMKSNMEIVKHLGLVDTKNIIPLSEMDNIAPDKVVMLVTGAQGEEFAALMRMANGTHKHIKLRKEDTILLSSSIIPTNHASVVNLKDRLYRSDARIITYLDSDVHASGHGNKGELQWIHEQIPYKFFVPLHGNHYMLKIHADLALELGVPKENIIVPNNGTIIEISDGGNKIEALPMSAPNDVVTVDGFAVGNIQDIVLDDRKMLSEAGIFVVVASINTRTGKLKKSPDIISRGFVYLRESQDLLRQSRFLTRKVLEDHMAKNKGPVDFDKMKKKLGDELSKFLLQETAKQPLVIPVLLGV
jgi:ribonuclease J